MGPSGGSYGNARGKMLELVRGARRRLLKSELISQGANAFTAALAAFIILLILGTQILEWYWLALIPLGAAIAGVYLALRRLPSPYRTAQLVDDRAQLADTLSTALYFSDKTESVSPDVLEWQRHRAEDAARRVDLPRILPYSVPRSAYAVAALALVASSLFALRYGLSRSLDLKPGLARMIRDQFTPADKKEVADNRREKPQGKDDSDTNNDAASQDQNQQSPDQPNADDPSDQGDSQSAEKNGDSKDQANKPNGDQDQQGQQGQDQQAGDRDDQQQNSGEQGSANQGENKGDSKQQSDGKQNSNNAGESGSLLSKMKDFAENLLSKIKPQQQNNSNPSQQSANQNSKQGQSQGQQQKGQPQNSKDGQQGQSDQADAQQAQNGEQRDGQESKGKGSGDKSQNNKQPGSGIGSEDGDKSIKRAEQLAAMGKITELVGKRSATVTGESTVEVQNTSQQLHTAYVQRGNAEHTQSGAEIDRDEVPVALQSYVEQYFDQVRKQPAAAPSPKKQQ